MRKLLQTLETLRQKRKLGLMTHVVVGYPRLEETIRLVKAMEETGADLIELQMPFSDPVADGPTILIANKVSLDQGTKMRDCLRVMSQLSGEMEAPLLFMGYYNLIFNYGVEKFCQDAAKAGAQGLIVPDIPPDEESEEHYYEACNQYGLAPIIVVSPASTEKRLKMLANYARGFVYAVSRYGITGARAELAPELMDYLKRVRQLIHLPLAVGFGISKKEHIQALAPHAEIAVVGSALINLYNQLPEGEKIEGIKKFIRELKN
ncbi:MAG TPA: tryptophan synthase subunit alpha [Candidatus Limnocylindrales bacterium]|nr:tryptophan synthase subunit alpha [Candidatus Limnocylindrales bacterium]